MWNLTGTLKRCAIATTQITAISYGYAQVVYLPAKCVDESRHSRPLISSRLRVEEVKKSNKN